MKQNKPVRERQASHDHVESNEQNKLMNKTDPETLKHAID
jgi:hypothetical protein